MRLQHVAEHVRHAFDTRVPRRIARHAREAAGYAGRERRVMAPRAPRTRQRIRDEGQRRTSRERLGEQRLQCRVAVDYLHGIAEFPPPDLVATGQRSTLHRDLAGALRFPLQHEHAAIIVTCQPEIRR